MGPSRFISAIQLLTAVIVHAGGCFVKHKFWSNFGTTLGRDPYQRDRARTILPMSMLHFIAHGSKARSNPTYTWRRHSSIP
jgi:hypothetical protein